MNYRPRRSRFSREQWEVQRERFQIDPDASPPIEDHTTQVREPVKQLMMSLGLSLDTLQHQLMNRWDTIAGTPLCRHIRPGPFQAGALTIYVSNSTMLSELTRFQGPALLKNIQAAVKDSGVKKLRFQIDPDTRPQSR